MFGLEDLFVVGIGFDIVGGYLVARGLLAKPLKIANRTTTRWGGFGPLAVAQAEDRASGWVGLISLVIGFTLQAVAYGIEGSADLEGELGGALIAAAVPVALMLGIERAIRYPWRDHTLIVAGRWDANERREQELPSAKFLAFSAVEIGFVRRDGETDCQLARRAFGERPLRL